jgi:hypothetical protein
VFDPQAVEDSLDLLARHQVLEDAERVAFPLEVSERLGWPSGRRPEAASGRERRTWAAHRSGSHAQTGRWRRRFREARGADPTAQRRQALRPRGTA